jgi:hypothetical protein
MTFPSTRTAVALGALLSLAAAPQAGAKKPESAGAPQQTAAASCDYDAARALFAPWHDNKLYVLVAGGTLEQGDAGWTLADGATVAEGNESFFANDAADHQALSLPAGSSATSPATCLASGQPTFRLFTQRTSGKRKARLKVEVLYLNAQGKKRSRVAGKLRSGEAWRPSKRLSVALGRAKGQGRLTTASIAFRFTPVRSAADWRVDDISLDPRARR